MGDYFDQAYSAAQEAVGVDLWERLSDLERLRAVRDQISKVAADQASKETAGHIPRQSLRSRLSH